MEQKGIAGIDNGLHGIASLMPYISLFIARGLAPYYYVILAAFAVAWGTRTNRTGKIKASPRRMTGWPGCSKCVFIIS
jgi:hypothetical protein